LFGDNRELDLAGLNVEDGIGRIALREKRLLLFVICQRSSFADFGQKYFGIEGSPRRSFHTTDFLYTHYRTARARKAAADGKDNSAACSRPYLVT
jgi:hypothetical protein